MKILKIIKLKIIQWLCKPIDNVSFFNDSQPKEVQNLIKRFIQYCESDDFSKRDRRRMAVQTQFNRNEFEIFDNEGQIRISKTTNLNVPYRITSLYMTKGQYSASIDESVYLKLKDIFFGEFKEDKKYLKRIGAVL